MILCSCLCGNLLEIRLLKGTRGKRCHTILIKLQRKGFFVVIRYKDAKNNIFSSMATSGIYMRQRSTRSTIISDKYNDISYFLLLQNGRPWLMVDRQKIETNLAHNFFCSLTDVNNYLIFTVVDEKKLNGFTLTAPLDTAVFQNKSRGIPIT